MPPRHPRTALHLHVPALLAAALGLVLAAGCQSDGDDETPPGNEQAEISTCFFGESAIHCASTPAWPDSDLRVRVEEFFPSACADSDHDHDRIPDFLDQDGGESSFGDEFRCRKCDRGPGESGDFRFEVDDGEAKLDRGRVYLRDGNQLIVPAPYRPLRIVLSAYTEIDDGIPAPGAEIRAEGWLREENEVVAERVKVLCRAPTPIPDDEIPPEAEPVQPEASEDQ